MDDESADLSFAKLWHWKQYLHCVLCYVDLIFSHHVTKYIHMYHVISKK